MQLAKSRILPLLGTLLIAALVPACTSEPVRPIPPEELEQRVLAELPPSMAKHVTVRCPGSLKAKVDASTDCLLSGGTIPVVATAKVTEVNTKTGEVSVIVSVQQEPGRSTTSPSAPEPTTPEPTDSESATPEPTDSESATPQPTDSSAPNDESN